MLIGFAGMARSGKSKAANYLLSHYPEEWDTAISFADPLKEAAVEIFGFPWADVHGLHGYDRETIHPVWGISVRQALQDLGSAVRETFGQDHWIKRTLLENPDDEERIPLSRTIITDVRYDNEVDAVKIRGGVIIGLIRDCEDMPSVRDHSSEEMARNRLHLVADHLIVASSLEELYSQLDAVVTLQIPGAARTLPSA